MHARAASSPVGFPPPPQGPSSPGISTSSLGRRVRSLAGAGQGSGPLTSLLGPNVSAWTRRVFRKPAVVLSSLLGSLILLFLLSSSSSLRSPPALPPLAYPAASGPYVASARHPASPGGDDPEGGTLCHPYHAFGHLTVEPDIPELNRYHPFADGCESPQLMRGLRHANGVGDSEAYVKHARADKGTAWRIGNGGRPKAENVSWLRGRTALLIGDSTARNQLEQFCAFIGEQFTIHPPAEDASREASGRQTVKRAGKDAAYTHACYAKKLDFLLVSVFHFGVDTEEFWKDKDSFNPPSTFEDRLEQLFVPLATDGGLERLLAEQPAPGTPKRSIDLIELSTGLWDLARFAKRDIDAGQSTITDLPRKELLWFSGRIAEMIGATVSAFPRAKVVWRSMHWPSDKDAKVDWFLGWNYGDETKHRPFFHHNRILQLEQAARAAISPDSSGGGFPSVEVSEWGSMLLGQHVHQMDQLHPGPLPAGYLGGDILLYELREAVLSRGQPQSV